MKYRVTVRSLKSSVEARFLFSSRDKVERFIAGMFDDVYTSGNRHTRKQQKRKGELMHFVIFSSAADLERVTVTKV